MAKTMTAAQPSMLKSAVSLWMKVTDPESAAMAGGPVVPLSLFAATRLCAVGIAWLGMNLAGTPLQLDLVGALCRGECLAAATPLSAHESVALWGLAQLAATAGIPAPALLLGVGNLAGLAALWLLYRVFARLSDERSAGWALALFALFPFAYLQLTGHRDALSLLATVGAAHLALDGHYKRAGLVGAVGVLADPFVALVSLLIGALHLRDHGVRRAAASSGIVGAALPLLALAALAAWLGLRFGTPAAVLASDGSQQPVGMQLLASLGVGAPSGMWAAALGAAVATLGAVCLVLRRPWAPLLIFALAWVFLSWTFARGGLASHAALCWPAFLPLGAWLSRRPSLQLPAIAVSATFFGAFALLYVRGSALG